jgi:uncharacterized membrane-anchored protein
VQEREQEEEEVMRGAAVLLMCAAMAGRGQEAKPEIRWEFGPLTVRLGEEAELEAPRGAIYAGGEEARRFLAATMNPQSGSELGVAGPVSLDWYAVFEFQRVGRVSEEGLQALDAAKVLRSLKSANERANAERVRQGWAPMRITGWVTPPDYDAGARRVSWAYRVVEGDGRVSVSRESRFFGRHGVLVVDLVCEEQNATRATAEWEALLRGVRFVGGRRWEDWRRGEPEASGGLFGEAENATIAGRRVWLWAAVLLIALALPLGVRLAFAKRNRN